MREEQPFPFQERALAETHIPRRCLLLYERTDIPCTLSCTASISGIPRDAKNLFGPAAFLSFLARPERGGLKFREFVRTSRHEASIVSRRICMQTKSNELRFIGSVSLSICERAPWQAREQSLKSPMEIAERRRAIVSSRFHESSFSNDQDHASVRTFVRSAFKA